MARTFSEIVHDLKSNPTYLKQLADTEYTRELRQMEDYVTKQALKDKPKAPPVLGPQPPKPTYARQVPASLTNLATTLKPIYGPGGYFDNTAKLTSGSVNMMQSTVYDETPVFDWGTMPTWTPAIPAANRAALTIAEMQRTYDMLSEAHRKDTHPPKVQTATAPPQPQGPTLLEQLEAALATPPPVATVRKVYPEGAKASQLSREEWLALDNQRKAA